MMDMTVGLSAHTDGWHDHMGWGGGWWMLLWGLLILTGLVVLAVWFVRTTVASGGTTPGSKESQDPLVSAKQILAERYARGELSSEEYRERLDHLG